MIISKEPSCSLWRVKAYRLALIVTFAIVALAALTGPQPAQAQGQAVAPQIEGSWLITVTVPGGPPPFRAIANYSAGGGLVVTDGSTPPSTGNVYQGTWARMGNHEFAFTFLGLLYTNGVHSGFFRVRETLRLEPGGDAYNGA